MGSVTTALKSFVGDVGAGQFRPCRTGLLSVTAGMLASGSPILSHIAKANGGAEKPLSAVRRMSNWAKNPRFVDDDVRQRGRSLVVQSIRKRYKRKRPVMSADFSDIQKPYSRTQEYVAPCFDGSTRKEGRGYPYLQLDMVSRNHPPLAVYARLGSTAHPDFRSRTAWLKGALNEIEDVLELKPVIVCDQGFDAVHTINVFGDANVDFVTRIRLDKTVARHVWLEGEDEATKASDLSSRLRVGWSGDFDGTTRGKKRKSRPYVFRWTRHVCIKKSTGTKVQRDDSREYSVVIAEWGRGGLIGFLTSLDVTSAKVARRICKWYFLRWSSEEGFRADKGNLDVENTRVLSWRALERIFLVGMLCRLFVVLIEMLDPVLARDIVSRAWLTDSGPRELFHTIFKVLRDELGGLAPS